MFACVFAFARCCVAAAVEEEDIAFDPTTAELDGLTFVVEDDEEDTGAALGQQQQVQVQMQIQQQMLFLLWTEVMPAA